ncbi:MAG TPA: PmoA family protein [Chthoniobacter sp.]
MSPLLPAPLPPISRRAFLIACVPFSLAIPALLAEPKPFPRVQSIPLPHDEVSFQRDGVEIARYYSGRDGFRPFVFPIIGPSGRSLTRMGHPHDPVTHSHHNSVWLSHQFVNGVNFWEDRGAHIVQQRLERLDDGPDAASIETFNAWQDKDGKTVMTEHRRTGVQILDNAEWLLLIDTQLEAPPNAPVTLGQTAFGLLGVRMAKTIGVNDGGGTIRNSEGGVDEAGCFRKPARWVDYSGPITPDVSEGITLLDHPQNPHHPTTFHVRNDGWMGAALTFPGEIVIEPGKPLRLRYALYVHRGIPPLEALQKRWEAFAKTEWVDFGRK